MKSRGRPGHLYSDVYDSTDQSSNLEGGEREALIHCYIARVRLDAILSRKIVLTDTQLLDGAFFLEAALTPPIEAVGDSSLKHLPTGRIEVRARSHNLEEALVRFIVNPNEPYLRCFRFSSLSESQRTYAQSELGKYRASEVKDWRDISTVLKRIGIEATETERLENCWARWIELASKTSSEGRPLLEVVPWDSRFSWVNSFERNISNDKDTVSRVVQSKFGDDTFKSVWEKRSYRSDVSAIINDAYAVATGNEKVDIATIHTWYNSAYNETSAEQHDCEIKDLSGIPDSMPTGEIDFLYDQIANGVDESCEPTEVPEELTVRIPPEFMSALAKLPVGTFDVLLDKHQQNLSAWHNNNDISRLRIVVTELVAAVEQAVGFQLPKATPSWMSPPLKLLAKIVPRAASGIASKGSGPILGMLSAGALNTDSFLGIILGGAIGAAVGQAMETGAKHVGEKLNKSTQTVRRIIKRAESLRSPK